MLKASSSMFWLMVTSGLQTILDGYSGGIKLCMSTDQLILERNRNYLTLLA